MKYLKIQNNGLLDIRLVALMGGTTKSNNDYKIGQFGTGLKYTLSFLFRNNLSFKIFVGKEEVNISTEKELICGEIFEIICINGNRTSITTKMGEDWSAWMIVRELWCNALDEGGAKRELVEGNLEGEEGTTTFFIQQDIQIKSVLKDWSKYFIHDAEVISQNGNYKLYPAGNRLCIYKQGVLIYEHPDDKGLFSYDIANANINELRQFTETASMHIAYALGSANETAVSYLLNNITEDCFEGKMDFDWYRSYGETWKNVIGNAKIIYPEVLKEIEARGNHPDRSSLIVIPKRLHSFLSKQFDNISAVYVASKTGGFVENFDEEIENRIKQGLTILEACNYNMHPDLKFLYGYFEDRRTLANVSLKEKIIRVSMAMVQKPLSDIVAMLIEENEHFNTGMDDNTREFQQHFINLYTRTLLAQHQIEV